MVEKVIYLSTAVKDLKSIYNFIARDSERYALLEVQKIKGFAQSLFQYPLKGRFFKTIKGKDIRLINFRKYVIFYHIINSGQIHVVSIHHQARSISNNPALKD